MIKARKTLKLYDPEIEELSAKYNIPCYRILQLIEDQDNKGKKVTAHIFKNDYVRRWNENDALTNNIQRNFPFDD